MDDQNRAIRVDTNTDGPLAEGLVTESNITHIFNSIESLREELIKINSNMAILSQAQQANHFLHEANTNKIAEISRQLNPPNSNMPLDAKVAMLEKAVDEAKKAELDARVASLERTINVALWVIGFMAVPTLGVIGWIIVSSIAHAVAVNPGIHP